MHQELETDYLVVGAGAAGIAFTDELLAHSDAHVTIVDRRHAPGGHWRDAYPFVRLHQPSRFYGVSSLALGQDAIDAVGTNAGFYELASADEICAYYERVVYRHFLGSGRVRYFPNCEYLGEHRFASRLTDAAWQVRVKRKLVDTTYIEGEIPATCAPPFELADGVRCVPAGDVPRIRDIPERYVVIGAGKTALDVCVWLLEQGVPASRIRWIKPREAWWLNRKFHQPLTLLPELYRGAARQFEVMAGAGSVAELFERLEEQELVLRVDPDVRPTMFHGAIVSESERTLLRGITDVVRMGHVRRITRDEIVLDEGRVPTSEGTLHVHCASRALACPPLRPIFEPARITVQPFQWGFACFQFAMLGVIEATVANDEEKNRMCPPLRFWDESEDFLGAMLATLAGERARRASPELAGWLKTTRLNPMSGAGSYADDPRMQEARECMKRFGPAAAANLQKLVTVKSG